MKQSKPRPQKQKSKLEAYRDCDTLPAKKFFKILKTDDFSLLITNDCSAEEYYSELEKIWDDILIEFDKLYGVHIFSNSILDKLDDVEELNQYLILRACFALMLLGDKRSLKILEDDFGYSIKEINENSLRKIRSKVNQALTRILIYKYDDEGEEESGDDYVKSVVQMSIILKLQINKELLTVSDWIYYDKEVQELKKVKNGRNNKD